MEAIFDSWRQEYINNYFWWGLANTNNYGHFPYSELQIYKEIRRKLRTTNTVKIIVENATQVQI